MREATITSLSNTCSMGELCFLDPQYRYMNDLPTVAEIKDAKRSRDFENRLWQVIIANVMNKEVGRRLKRAGFKHILTYIGSHKKPVYSYIYKRGARKLK